MKIFMHSWSVSDKYYLFKRLLIMKLTLFLILVFNLGAFADVYSQTKISVNFKEADLKRALSIIERNSSYRFVYSDRIASTDKKITINANNENVTDVLDKILGDLGLVYKELNDNHLIAIAPFDKIATTARNTSGLSFAAFWNSSISEFSDARGCLSNKSNISFPAASMASDLMGLVMIPVSRHHTIVYRPALALLARLGVDFAEVRHAVRRGADR